MDKTDIYRTTAYEEKTWSEPWVTEAELRNALQKENRPLIKELGRTPLPSEYGDLTYLVFGDYTTGKDHDVIIFGKFDGKNLTGYDNPLLRIHSSCRSSELFHASNCECREELDLAMKTMSKEGKGIIIYLNQEGAGNGISAKIATYKNSFEWHGDKVVLRMDPKTKKPTNVYEGYIALGYKPENRDFTIAGEILKAVGVKQVRLMTNNPKKIAGLKAQGINVEAVSIKIPPTNEIMREHLNAKKEKLGHNI